MSERMARNLMAVAAEYGTKTAIVADLVPTALYALASAEADVQVEVERRVAAGELVSVAEVTRECLALVADTSLSGTRVARELDRLLIDAVSRRWWSATTAASSPATPS